MTTTPALQDPRAPHLHALLQRNMEDSITAKQHALADCELRDRFCRATTLVIDAYSRGGRLYIAGNGGSAADAQHLAAEFVSRLASDRAPLPAEALTTDSSILTAIGNDYGFDLVFARQLRAKMGPMDVFLGITTSGRSRNILRALDVCKELGRPSILLTGHDGGPAAELAQIALIAPGKRTSVIQELHITLAHSLCEAVEDALFFS